MYGFSPFQDLGLEYRSGGTVSVPFWRPITEKGAQVLYDGLDLSDDQKAMAFAFAYSGIPVAPTMKSGAKRTATMADVNALSQLLFEELGPVDISVLDTLRQRETMVQDKVAELTRAGRIRDIPIEVARLRLPSLPDNWLGVFASNGLIVVDPSLKNHHLYKSEVDVELEAYAKAVKAEGARGWTVVNPQTGKFMDRLYNGKAVSALIDGDNALKDAGLVGFFKRNLNALIKVVFLQILKSAAMILAIVAPLLGSAAQASINQFLGLASSVQDQLVAGASPEQILQSFTQTHPDPGLAIAEGPSGEAEVVPTRPWKRARGPSAGVILGSMAAVAIAVAGIQYVRQR